MRLERRDQRRLRALQRPARRRDPDVLVTVRVAEHDELAATTDLDVSAVQVVGEKRSHHLRRGREIVAGLEQGGDVEGVEPCPPRQQQHRERVVRSLRHADDVRADGAWSVTRLAFRDRLEHGERALGLRVRRGGGRFPGCEGAVQPARALRARALEPTGIVEQTTRHGTVHQRVLAHVERGQMEAERFDTSLEAPHAE